MDLEEQPNPHMVFEAANPLWWCPRDYALVRIDTRGSGKSPGKSDPSSYQEALDYYDAIEWIATRPWCTGNIGLLGISYLRELAVARGGAEAPSLKAIIPWEARADQYRDQAYHGGIFAMGFLCTLFAVEAAHHLLGGRARTTPTRSTTTCSGTTCATTSIRSTGAFAARVGTASTCRFTPPATGADSRCICAATPKRS